jgi:hypothetical protein
VRHFLLQGVAPSLKLKADMGIDLKAEGKSKKFKKNPSLYMLLFLGKSKYRLCTTID